MSDVKTKTEAIQILRKQTNFTISMPDCKRALLESNGDLDQALSWLKQQGLIEKEKFEDWIFTRTANESAYILMQAQCNLRMEPNASYKEWKYRFDMPLCIAKKVRSALQQIVDGKGYTPETPLCGIGVEAFYSMMDVLGFELCYQEARFEEDFTMDKMVIAHRLTADEVTLFNRVEKCPSDDEDIEKLLSDLCP
jgi:hypothetical protein